MLLALGQHARAARRDPNEIRRPAVEGRKKRLQDRSHEHRAERVLLAHVLDLRLVVERRAQCLATPEPLTKLRRDLEQQGDLADVRARALQLALHQIAERQPLEHRDDVREPFVERADM